MFVRIANRIWAVCLNSSDFIWDFGKLPFPTHLGKYLIKIGKIRAKIHEIGKIKAIFGLGMTPIYGLKNGQIKPLNSYGRQLVLEISEQHAAYLPYCVDTEVLLDKPVDKRGTCNHGFVFLFLTKKLECTQRNHLNEIVLYG